MENQSHITTLSSLISHQGSSITAGFDNSESFIQLQRVAKVFAASTFVPKEYSGDNGLPNCIVAVNMALRLKADPLMVMQNLYIVHGRPAWSSQWIIAAINNCGKYSPLRFDIIDLGEKEVEYQESKGYGKEKTYITKKITIQDKKCIAWAKELRNGERLESPTITIEMAVKEGWYTKDGSKWKTMPEVMLRYRTASFFGKLYAPELLMGLQTAEELHDIIDIDSAGNVTNVTSAAQSTETLKRKRKTVDPESKQDESIQEVTAVIEETNQLNKNIVHDTAILTIIEDIKQLRELKSDALAQIPSHKLLEIDTQIANDFIGIEPKQIIELKTYLAAL